MILIGSTTEKRLPFAQNATGWDGTTKFRRNSLSFSQSARNICESEICLELIIDM